MRLAGGQLLMLAIAASGGSILWFATRATGMVAMILLTVVVVLGIVEVRRFASDRWPRFLIDALHRQATMLAVVFLAVHIATSVLDPFAPVGWIDTVVPFHSAYRPIWLGFGAVAFDMLLAVSVTSALRERVGHRTWRAVHWLAYACWPVAIIHGLGTGSDVRQGWMLAITTACVAAVIGAVVVRVTDRSGIRAAWRTAALGLSAAFVGGLLIWTDVGPLGTNWAARAGTPAALLGHSASTRSARR